MPDTPENEAWSRPGCARHLIEPPSAVTPPIANRFLTSCHYDSELRAVGSSAIRRLEKKLSTVNGATPWLQPFSQRPDRTLAYRYLPL